MTGKYVPARGDIVWLQFSTQAGHEQAGRRPALVVSPLEYNKKVGLALLCPITSRKKGYPFEVELPGELEIEGVVLSDQIKSLGWRSRKARLICAVPKNVLEDVLAKISVLVSIE